MFCIKFIEILLIAFFDNEQAFFYVAYNYISTFEIGVNIPHTIEIGVIIFRVSIEKAYFTHGLISNITDTNFAHTRSVAS